MFPMTTQVKLSKAQRGVLRRLARGVLIIVSPPCHFGGRGGLCRWGTFRVLNDHGLAWARPRFDLNGNPVEPREQTPPGHLYYGGQGCFDQEVLITDAGRLALRSGRYVRIAHP